MFNWRIALGLILAPGIPALFLYFVGLIFVSGWEAAWSPKFLAAFGYLVALIFGIPAFYYLQRKGINSFQAYLILGALIGLTFYLLFFGIWALLSWQPYPEHAILLLKNSIKSGIIAIVYATVTSAVFWLITIRGQ